MTTETINTTAGCARTATSRSAPRRSGRVFLHTAWFFRDFVAVHEGLGISDMLSIEREKQWKRRIIFNKPYKCIGVEFDESNEVLPKQSWTKRSIVWLDYVDLLGHKELADVEYLMRKLRSGSAVIVSINVHPERRPTVVSADDEEDEGDSDAQAAIADLSDQENGDVVVPALIPDYRLRRLKKRIPSRLLPLVTWKPGEDARPLKEPDLAGWGTARVAYAAMRTLVKETLNSRNQAGGQGAPVEATQFAHFQYADGAKMLTVGWLLLDEADRASLGDDAFSGLEFWRTGESPYRITPPVLTAREIRHLNQRLPAKKLARPNWLRAKERSGYADVYRFYPYFAETEA